MGGVHKKKLRAEKAKVKLKGAKLPKGLNVTKTEFKVRKITLREQLKESQYADGQRQLNLKEILSKLKHHSSNFRIESLRNLRDAINTKHPGLLPSLNNIIQGISATALDIERDARRESFKTLSSLLGFLTSEAVAPFFHIISSYLRCAMTHIQPAIQEDALLMLDVLLQHVPSLVAIESKKIFTNFLEMISRVRAEGDKAGRMLTVNMGQRQTTIKWRSKVLLRLQHMLQILVEHKRQDRENARKSSNKINTYVTFSAKAEQHYGIKRSFASNQFCDLSSIFNRTTSSSGDIDKANDESIELHSYVEHLMPLLLESWLEVRPQLQDAKSGTMETLLTPDAAITLKIVLEIIQNLWSLIEIYEEQVNNQDLSVWLKHQYADVFAANFLQDAYPYQQMVFEESSGGMAKKKSKKTSTEMTPFCYQQNITLGFLMCRFYSNTLDAQASRFKAVLDYITKILHTMSSKNANDYAAHLVVALRALLLDSGLMLLQLHPDATIMVLRSCIRSFLTNKFTEIGMSAKILILLCAIIQNSELYAAYGSSEFSEFLQFLPSLLLKETINESCLVAMGRLGKQQNTIFLDALRNILPKVLNNLQAIQVVGAINVFEGKKHIINLFYWLKTEKCWQQKDLKLLFLEAEKLTDKRISGYCQYVLTLLQNKH